MKTTTHLCFAALILFAACQSDSTSDREAELARKERALIQKENELILKQQQQELEEKELALMAKEEALDARERKADAEKRYHAFGLGEFPEASTRYLDYNDISHLTKDEMTIMRNEIFARHGYTFKTQWLQDYFSKYSWYRPLYTDVSYQLSEIERANVKFILQYEKR
ncbi:MAG: YARHG domain-containing protein [Bacteroidia bacterium]